MGTTLGLGDVERSSPPVRWRRSALDRALALPSHEAPLQLPLVDYRPVERLKLPARFHHNGGHVG